MTRKSGRSTPSPPPVQSIDAGAATGVKGDGNSRAATELGQSILLKQEGLTWANMRDHLAPDISNASTATAMDLDASDGDDKAAAASAEADSNTINSPTFSRLKREDMKMFGSSPIFEDLVLVQCVDCRRSLLPSSFAEHVKRCRLARRRSTVSSSRGSMASSRTDADGNLLPADDAANSAADGNEEPKYQEPIPGFPLRRKRSGPVDLDSQCAVITPLGTPCTRPLSCLVHSMYAKACVVGRSRDFDVLFRDYHERLANAIHPHTPSHVEALFADPRRRSSASAATAATSMTSLNNINERVRVDSAVVDQRDMDADKDIDALVEILHHRVVKPAAVPSYVRVRHQTVSLRMRDLFLSAFGKVPVKHSDSAFNAMNISKGPAAGLTAPAPVFANSGGDDSSAVAGGGDGSTVAASTTTPKKKPRSRKSAKSNAAASAPVSAPAPVSVAAAGDTALGDQQMDMFGGGDNIGGDGVNPADLMGGASKVDPRDFKFM